MGQPVDARRFWLLNIVVRGVVRLRLITDSQEDVSARFNIIPHPMSFETVARELASCFEDRLILATEFDCRSGSERADGLVLDVKDILQVRNCSSLDYGYYLTSTGGAEWESIAIPDWSLFNEVYFSKGPTKQMLCVEAASVERIRERVRSFEENEQVNWSERELKELSPWTATYWKTLRFGCMCSLPVHPARSWSGLEYYNRFHNRPRNVRNEVWCQRGFSGAECQELVVF